MCFRKLKKPRESTLTQADFVKEKNEKKKEDSRMEGQYTLPLSVPKSTHHKGLNYSC